MSIKNQVNKQDRKTNSWTQAAVWWLAEGKEGRGREEKVKGIKYVVMKRDLILGDRNRMQYTDHVL